jgi:exonuclease III
LPGKGLKASKSVKIYTGKLEFTNFLEERFLEIRIKLLGRIISLYNIYSPNEYNEQINFIEDLYNVCKNNHFKILCGDFNSKIVENESSKKHERTKGYQYENLVY